MVKHDMVTNLAQEYSLTIKLATEIVSSIFDSITSALVSEDKVSIAGFGVFNKKERAARIGRNPQTGKQLKIAAKKVVRFAAGKELKEAIQ